METIYSIIVFLIGIFLAVYIFSVFFQIMPVVAIILIIVAVGLIIYNAQPINTYKAINSFQVVEDTQAPTS